jgi:hypothetical protein
VQETAFPSERSRDGRGGKQAGAGCKGPCHCTKNAAIILLAEDGVQEKRASHEKEPCLVVHTYGKDSCWIVTLVS